MRGESIDELAQAFSPLRPMTLAAGHGRQPRPRTRAHCQAARLPGRIWVPGNTAKARIDAIRAEGASVAIVDGGYDDAVAAAAKAGGEQTLVVSDTSWDGNEEIPGG